MIDVDEEKRLQAAQPGAIEAVALQQNRGVIGAVNAHDATDGLSAGQGAVSGGNAIGGDQVGALAHGFQQHAHSQHGAHSVAVRTRVGADQEALAAAEHVENGGDGIFGQPSRRSGGSLPFFIRIAGRAGVVRAGIGIHRAHKNYSAAFLWRLRERSISSSIRA